MAIFIGIVINPKTYEPCPVFKDKKRSVIVYAGSTAYEGQGYFDEGEGEYAASEQSGYPRVHTPDGVRTRKMGYGTVLYTGLCLASHLRFKRELSLDVMTVGDGVSSNENRSHAAEHWWAQAKELGLAHEVDVEGTTTEEEVEEDFDIDIRSSSPLSSSSTYRKYISELEDAMRELMQYTDHYGSIDRWSLNIEGTETRTEERESEYGTADVYPFEEAQQFVALTSIFDAGDDVGYGNAAPSETLVDNLQEIASVGEVTPEIFSLIAIKGADEHLVKFLADYAKQNDLQKEWQSILAFAVLGKRLEDMGMPEDEMYAEFHPLARENPSDALSKKEKKLVVAARAELIRELGIDRFADIDDSD